MFKFKSKFKVDHRLVIQGFMINLTRILKR